MEFADVVMRRRAVRRFVDGGVDHEVLERIARLAQRTPSAGFSQGQRLVVVTDPEVRRRVGAACGEDEDEDVFGHWVSECAAQFVPCVSEAIYHRRYQEPDKIDDDGREIDWPVPFWWVDIGATMQTIMLAAVDAGLGCGFAGPEGAWRRCATCWAFQRSSPRSASCPWGRRCRTSGRPRSSAAGSRSSSSRAGTAGAELEPGGSGGRDDRQHPTLASGRWSMLGAG